MSARPWTLEDLAREAKLSPPHFTALCRRQTGMPPLSLLIRLRLQRAMDLLQRGNHNMAEAARAVGYEDPFYFSRLYKNTSEQLPRPACTGRERARSVNALLLAHMRFQVSCLAA